MKPPNPALEKLKWDTLKKFETIARHLTDADRNSLLKIISETVDRAAEIGEDAGMGRMINHISADKDWQHNDDGDWDTRLEIKKLRESHVEDIHQGTGACDD